MIHLLFALFLPFSTQASSAVMGFEGWTEDTKVQGDLNGDGVPDTVITFKGKKPEGGDGERGARLAVYFGGKAGLPKLLLKTDTAVCMGCGGMKADPDSVVGVPSITPKGILVLTYEGGAREMWSYALKWRWDAKKNRFLLIGDTYSSTDTLSPDGSEPGTLTNQDINFSTLKMIRKIAGKGTLNCKVDPKYKGLTLEGFNFDKYSGEPDKFIKDTCKK